MSVERDHRHVVADLAPEMRERLTRRRDLPGTIRFALHFGLVAALGAAIALGLPGWPMLLPVQGVALIFLFTTLHEAIHETAFRSQWIGTAVANICGFLVLTPPVWFRFFHFAHHRHTQNPEKDPELITPRPSTIPQYAWYLTGIPLWRHMVETLIGNALGRCDGSYVPPKATARVVTEARRFAALYAALAAVSLVTGSAVLFWVWVLPAIIGQPFLRAYLLAEHAFCPQVFNMLENTRTTFTNWIVHFIAWNMPYHAEHHAFPSVPFHQLPAFHREIARQLHVTERGYGRFHASAVRRLSDPISRQADQIAG